MVGLDQHSVSELINISNCGLLFQCTSTITIQLHAYSTWQNNQLVDGGH